jgi:hypothetical protein
MFKNRFNGMPLISNANMYDLKIVQLKKHKKKRINKKWLKRYGTKTIKEPQKTIIYTNFGIFGHPETIKKITKKMKRKDRFSK